MIRVNLLPVTAARRRAAAERGVLLMGVGLVAVALALAGVHQVQVKAVASLARGNVDLEKEIAELKEKVGDFDRLKATRDRLMAQRAVIEKLKAARQGPVHVLLELSRILSEGGQPTMEAGRYELLLRDDPNKAYTPNWDPRRLIVSDYTERSGRVDMIGYAKDNSDVAEFTRRLWLSDFFIDPYMERTDAIKDSPAAKGFKHVKFNLSVGVKY
jgi:Tfp pilus assembly protein PilN